MTTLPILGGRDRSRVRLSLSSAGSVVVVDMFCEDAVRMALVENHEVVKTLTANRNKRAARYAFCPVECASVTTSRIRVALTRLWKRQP
jgi:hypothetical protein